MYILHSIFWNTNIQDFGFKLHQKCQFLVVIYILGLSLNQSPCAFLPVTTSYSYKKMKEIEPCQFDKQPIIVIFLRIMKKATTLLNEHDKNL